MSDGEEGGSPAAEARKRESKLLARTRNAGKQAVVFDEDEDEGGGHVATAIQAPASMAKTWSPGSGAGSSSDRQLGALAEAPAGSGFPLQSLSPGGGGEAVRDLEEEKAAAKVRAERIAKRAAKLREIEERDGGTAGKKGAFGRTFGGDGNDAYAGGEDVAAPGAAPKTALSKLDHREVFGNRSSAVDGLLDLGVGAQRKKASGAQDGLDLDAGSMRRGGLAHSPRAQKGNRASKRAEEERRKEAYFADREAAAAPEPSRHAEHDDDGLAPDREAASETPADGIREDEMGEVGDMDDMDDEDDGPLGAMLKDMASKLGNYGDRRELERELQVLKAALAGEDGDKDGSGDAEALPRASRGIGAQEGPHRSSVGKVSAAEIAGGMGGGRARDGAPAGARAPQAIVRDDISSSDDSADEGPRPRGPAGRRPHVYLAQGLREAAASSGRATLPGGKQEKRERGSGSDDEQDMRPVTPPSGSEASESALDNEGLGAPKFVGSKTWSPQRGAEELHSKPAGAADDDDDDGRGGSNAMAAKRAERQQKLERLPKSNLHHTGIETFTDAAALEHRDRMRKLEQEEAARQQGVADMQSETTSVVGEEDSPPSSRPSTSDGRFLGDRGKGKRGDGGGGRFTQTYSLKHPFRVADDEADDFRRKTPHVMGGVVFCGECGEPNKSGALYCSCGEPLADDDDYSSPSKPRLPTPDNKGPSAAGDGGGMGGGERPAQGSERSLAGSMADAHQHDGHKDAGGEGGKPSTQRHRGAPKVPIGGGARGFGDQQRPVADEGNAREEGLTGEGAAQGGWKLAPEPKDDSDEEDSPRGRERARERERERAREAREREALAKFQDTQAAHEGGGVGGDTLGADGKGGAGGRAGGDGDGGGSREQQVAEAPRGQSAESEVSSRAEDSNPAAPVSSEILRGEAARRHRRAPAKAAAAPSDVSSDAGSDTMKRALEEADEMMQMFAPPKRATQDAKADRGGLPSSTGAGGAGMMDPFLKSLGMPETIPEGRWGEGEEQSDDEHDSAAKGRGVQGAHGRNKADGRVQGKGKGPDAGIVAERDAGHGAAADAGNIFVHGNDMMLQDKTNFQQQQQLQQDKPKGMVKSQQRSPPVGEGSFVGAGGGRRIGGGQDLDNSFETQADTVVTKFSSVSAAVMDPAVIRALREAKALLDDGVLTEDEFKHQKRIILEGGANPYGIQQYGGQQPPPTRDGLIGYDEGTPVRQQQLERGAVGMRILTADSQSTIRPPRVQTAESSEDQGPVKWVSDDRGVRKAQWAPRVDKSGLVSAAAKEDAPTIQMKTIRPSSALTVMSSDLGDVQHEEVQALTVEALERHQAVEAARASQEKWADGSAGNPLRGSKDRSQENLKPMPAAPRRGRGKMIADPDGVFIPENNAHVAAGERADDTPLFMRDHNEEVERLRRQAEQELAELEAVPDQEYEDVQGLRNAMAQRRLPATDKPHAQVRRSKEGRTDEEELVVTDAAIRDAWRQRETAILQTLADPVPSWQLPAGEMQSVKGILMQRQQGGEHLPWIDDGTSELDGRTDSASIGDGHEPRAGSPTQTPRRAAAVAAFNGAGRQQPPQLQGVLGGGAQAKKEAGVKPVRRAGAAEGMGGASGKRYINMSEDGTETGWGSDVSSEDEPQVVVDPYDEDPFAHVFDSAATKAEAQAIASKLDSASNSPAKPSGGALLDGEGNGAGEAERGGGAAHDFEAEAKRLEWEAASLKEAARITEEQRKLREAAEQEAERAREELEIMRKQMAAMDDRIKATTKLDQRQKMAAVESIISEVIDAAVDKVEEWWAAQAAAAEKDAEEGEEEDDEDIVMDDEGNGDDELEKWQKIREKELKQNRKRRVTFDVAAETPVEPQKSTVVAKGTVSFQIHEGPVAEAEKHAQQLEAELREAEEEEEKKTGAGGRTVAVRKPVVQFVNPDDISSSDEDDNAKGGGESESESNWPDEDEENQDDMWAALDPELMLKLQTLSAVLIQRAYRLYRARRLSTPWASEVSWPSSAQSGLFAQADEAKPEVAKGGVAAPLDEGDAEAQALAAMPLMLQDQEILVEAEGRQQGVVFEGGTTGDRPEAEEGLHLVDDQAAAPAKNGEGELVQTRVADDAAAAESAEVAAAGELSKQIEAAALAGAVAGGSGVENVSEADMPSGGNSKARGGSNGKLQPAAHVLRLARAGMVARGFENAAQVFVYFETGSSSGDVITGVEIERGLRALKLDGQVDGPSLLAALGAKGKGLSDAHVSYKDFMRQLSMAISGPNGDGWGGLGGGAAVGKDSIVMLENARKSWKKTAERVRRHVQVSKEAEQQRARLREQDEARSELFALRKQLGTKGVPFSARGHISARGAAARKGLSKGLAGASRTLGAITSRELAAFHPVATGGDRARKSGLSAGASRVKALTLGPKGSVRPPKPSATAGPSVAVEVQQCVGKEGGDKHEAVQATESDPEGGDGAKRVVMLPAAAARKIQWKWRTFRGEKWQADVASLSAFPALPGALENDAAADSLQDFRATDGDSPDDERRLSNRHRSRQVPEEANHDAGIEESRAERERAQAEGEEAAERNAAQAQTPEPESQPHHDDEAGNAAQLGPAPGAQPRMRRKATSTDEAAILIQTRYREYAKRQMEFLERQLQLQEARDEAAVRMQGVARGFLCRLRLGIRPKAKRYTESETPAATQRSAAAAAAPASVPPTASSSASAVSATDRLPEMKRDSARTQPGETADAVASSAAPELQGTSQHAQQDAAATREGAGGQEACQGMTKPLTLDLSKLPEPKDLRGKVVGQKGSVPLLRERTVPRRVPENKVRGGEAKEAGARLAKTHQPAASSKGGTIDAPLMCQTALAPTPAGEVEMGPGAQAGAGAGGQDGVATGGVGGREALPKQRPVLKYKGEGGGGEKRRTGGAGKAGGSSKAKKVMAADMMFLCDDAVQEAHNQWALNALRDSSEWEKALDAELAKGDEEHSTAKGEAAAAVDREMESREVSQGGEIMRGTPQKLAASAATRPAAMPSRSREEKPEAPMLDPNDARLRETVVEELSAQLAALHARGEDLQAREEQAAAEEHFHDAAALHDEWLKLRSQVKQLERDLAAALAPAAEDAGMTDGFADAALLFGGSIDKPPHAEEGYHAAAIHQDSARMDLKRLSSWPRQRAPTTGSGRDSGGAGKIVKQRRVGWASGDASGGEGRVPHRDAAVSKRRGSDAYGVHAASNPVQRDEYGLPAPAMSSDEDEDEDVVQGVLQRRQEQLAATTAMASTWAPSGVSQMDVPRPPSADSLYDDLMHRVGAGGGGDAFGVHLTPLNFEHLVQHGSTGGAGVLWDESLREGALSAPLVHMGSFDEADLAKDRTLALQGGRGRGAKTSTKLPKLGTGKGVGKVIGARGGGVGGWMHGESAGKSGGVRRVSESSPYVVEVRRISKGGGGGGGGGNGGSLKAEMGSGQMAVVRRLAREHVKEEGAGNAKKNGGVSASSPSAFDHLRAVSR